MKHSATVEHSYDVLSGILTPTPLYIASNQRILGLTATFFTIFVLCEVVGAIAGHSLSLLGDAGAMSVDVFTYICNMYAEHVKSTHAGVLPLRTRIIVEILIPSFSLSILLASTVWVCVASVQRLLGHVEEENVNVYYLYAFALANLVVDIVCAMLFYFRGREVFLHSPAADSVGTLPPEHLSSASSDSNDAEHNDDIELLREYSQDTVASPEEHNLNMISAFTHIGGDTLRTFAVLIAAILSSVTSIDASVLDAWAAILVSLTIFGVVIPLILAIVRSVRNIMHESKKRQEVLCVELPDIRPLQ